MINGKSIEVANPVVDDVPAGGRAIAAPEVATAINLERAKSILLRAILEFGDRPAVSEPLRERAREMNLEIDALNYTRGNAVGFVIGQDDKSWLIWHRTRGAVVLNFEEILPGEPVPEFGDRLFIRMRHGISQVTIMERSVKTAARRAKLGGASTPSGDT